MIEANIDNSSPYCLEVRELSVSIRDPERRLKTGEMFSREMVSGVSFAIKPGQTLGLVGESGCGKSLTAMAVVDLLPKPQAYRSGGQILLDGETISGARRHQLQQLRGGKTGVVFQDPMTALNPVHRTGQQIDEVLRLHFPAMGKLERRRRCLELLRDVGIPAAEQRIDAYPHQLSGGMRQRLMIAMALAGEPQLLIADEPTTALDVTIQAQIVGLLKRLQQQKHMAMLFITHDLGLVSQVSDQVAVMYAGQIVEQQSVADIFRSPRHPYTRGLLAALPGAMERKPKTPLSAMPGQVPGIDAMPKGCRFANRCTYRQGDCEHIAPELLSDQRGRIACHHWQAMPCTPEKCHD